MNPPMSEPAIPSSIVTMKPPGSFPGIRSLAIKPTTRPNTIHDRIAIARPPFVPRGVAMQACDHSRNGRVGARSILKERQPASLVFEQPAFALEATAVTREGAIRTDDAVARDDHGDGVGAVRGAYGTDSIRVADGSRQVRVRRRATSANQAKRFPHALLEGCADELDLEPIE